MFITDIQILQNCDMKQADADVGINKTAYYLLGTTALVE
jgi:hypothetical protein